jgi:hypothetical protein
MLQQSIQEVDSIYRHPEDEICLGLDDQWIIEITGHYLIYGSEYLFCLVKQLPIQNTERYLSVLRKDGRPTFIKVNLPNASEYGVPYDKLERLFHDMILNWVYNVAHSRTESGWLDFTFSIDKPLAPKHICEHYNPTKVNDAHMGNRIYNAETGEYENTD